MPMRVPMRVVRKKAGLGARVKRRRRRGTNRSCKGNDGPGTGMGGAVTAPAHDLTEPPKQENSTLPKTTSKDGSTQTPFEQPDLSRKCPNCSSLLKTAVDAAGRTTQLLQCSQCSDTTPLCECCLYPCPHGTCTNQLCQLVYILLTCEPVTNLSSKVFGCPQFRACPKCHSLMLHETGCKYVICACCKHRYCFICLRITQECVKDKDKYWSLTCSKPKAARQRFQT